MYLIHDCTHGNTKQEIARLIISIKRRIKCHIFDLKLTISGVEANNRRGIRQKWSTTRIKHKRSKTTAVKNKFRPFLFCVTLYHRTNSAPKADGRNKE